ncbi:MAG: RDD family protein [Opitutae bacterium]|nr:RDD family protein [Opitutae bacterium]
MAEEKAAPAPTAEPPAVAVEEKPAAPDAPAAAPAAPVEEKKLDAPLRELGAESDKASTGPEKAVQEEKKSGRTRGAGVSTGRKSSNERISFGHDSTLAAGEQADAVVSILGSSTSAGEVSDAIVSVIGNTRVTGGTVGDAAVAVLGDVHINGHVRGEVVAVMGNVELGPEAVVDGEIVCIGGAVQRDAKATVKGNVQNIAIGGRHFNFAPLQTWFTECLLYARPLAFHANLWWAWCIAIAALGFYALLALVAPAGVNKCVTTLEEEPGYSILAAVLTLLLTPVAYLLLVLTLALAVGFVLIPLFSMGLFFAALFGKVVMLAWLGRRITKLFGDGPLAQPVFAVLIGGLIVLGLYTVPILGFILYKLIGFLGLGVVIYTLLLMFKSSRKAAAATAAAATPPPVGGTVAGVGPVPALPPVISAATLPRAGFWRRFIASVLDAVIVGMAFGMIHSIWHGFGGIFPFWFAVYCVILWAAKGTTVGGIICGLKVVRLDDRPVDWGVSIVRALGGFLSLAVAGLGFIWVVFDDDRQSWHDKIAGTTIVVVPKGTPLL